MGVKTSTNRYICNYFIIILGKRKVPENGFTKPFLGLLAGWASWIRTSGMRESKSRALPLGDGPLLQNGKSACEFAVPDFKWGGRWDSNPRQPEPQSGALPTELHPPYRMALENDGTPEGTRTPDPLLRRQLLYPPELQALMERVMGIEPTRPAWKAGILPLNYTRMGADLFGMSARK